MPNIEMQASCDIHPAKHVAACSFLDNVNKYVHTYTLYQLWRMYVHRYVCTLYMYACMYTVHEVSIDCNACMYVYTVQNVRTYTLLCTHYKSTCTLLYTRTCEYTHYVEYANQSAYVPLSCWIPVAAAHRSVDGTHSTSTVSEPSSSSSLLTSVLCVKGEPVDWRCVVGVVQDGALLMHTQYKLITTYPRGY